MLKLTRSPYVKYLHPVKFPNKFVFSEFQTDVDKFVGHENLPIQYSGGVGILRTLIDPLHSMEHNACVVSRIFDVLGSLMGKYEYSMNLASKKIGLGYIETSSKHRGKGIGEIMRLASIMELKENKMNAIELESLPSAVPFHAKYKFKPNLESSEVAMLVLKQIKHISKVDDAFIKQADILLKSLKKDKSSNMSEENAKKVNDFVETYIRTYGFDWENFKFKAYLPMVLTSERIEQSSKFFNELFKKHGIDYQV